MIDRAVFFARMRRAFGRLNQAQVDNAEFLLTRLEVEPGLTVPHIAYLLATVWHETDRTLAPILEYGSRAYINGLYDPVEALTAQRRARARHMGNTQPGDGWRYRGRGYVQLTWATNYRLMGELLEIDLAGNPDLALVPEHAYRILHLGMTQGLFTGRRLGDYLTPERNDYIGARRVVNGRDRASLIAGHARDFEHCIQEAA